MIRHIAKATVQTVNIQHVNYNSFSIINIGEYNLRLGVLKEVQPDLIATY